jgi:hypothetical protein
VRSVSTGVALILVVVGAVARAEAQDLEPRAFNNAPVGLNFLILGYGYTQGDVAFDTSSPIKDAQLTVNGAGLAYARSLDVFGMAGKFDALLPFASVNGTAKVFGEERERNVAGLGDPRVRFSLLWYGAPALTLELATSATFYTDNDDFFVHCTLKTDPLYAVQAHVIYHTRLGPWPWTRRTMRTARRRSTARKASDGSTCASA